MELDDLLKSLNNQGFPAWATEDTLQKLVKALGTKGSVGDFAKSIGRTGDKNPKTLIGGLNQTSASLTGLNKQSSSAAQTFKSFAAGAGGILGTLVQSRGRFQDLNPIIGAVSAGMKSIADDIPYVGGLIKAIIGVTEEVMKLNNVIADDLLDNFYSLGRQGFSLNGSLQEVQKRALAAGVSFQGFTNAITNNIPGILAFGGDLEKGTDRFTKSLSIMTDPGGDMMKGMKSFGYSAEDTADFLGEFITANRNSLRLQNMSDREVAEVAFDYAKSLRVIAELTGQQVDDIRANRLAQLSDGAFQSKLQQLRNANQEELADAMQNFAGDLRGLSPEVEKAFKDTTAGLMTQQTALLLATIPGLEEAFLNRDIDAVRNLIAGLAKDSNALQIGTLGLLDASNPLSELITSLVPVAQYLAGIVEQGPTKGDLETQQQEQLDRLNGVNGAMGKFETDLITVATNLEQFPKKIQSMVIDNLAKAAELQLDFFADLVNTLRPFASKGYTEEQLDSVDKIIEDYATSAEFLASGGPTGQGLYLVGERGPELLRLDQGSMGHVYSHGQTNSLLRGRSGGGGVNGSTDPKNGSVDPNLSMDATTGSNGSIDPRLAATLAYFDGEVIHGSRTYQGKFEVAWSDTGVMGEMGMDSPEYKQLMADYKASGKSLNLDDIDLAKEMENIEFGDDGQVTDSKGNPLTRRDGVEKYDPLLEKLVTEMSESKNIQHQLLKETKRGRRFQY